MAQKNHWAIPVSSRHLSHTWEAYDGSRYVKACGRKFLNGALPESAGAFVKHANKNPDWHCLDCAKAARLALAAESAPNPDAVVWPKPRPISEARETEILGYCPDIGWRRLSQMGRKWALTGAEYIADYEPSHFLPLPPEVR